MQLYVLEAQHIAQAGMLLLLLLMLSRRTLTMSCTQRLQSVDTSLLTLGGSCLVTYGSGNCNNSCCLMLPFALR
jgi:hypothetical protein